MKIAYISFEYPPDSAFGGIATYVRQAAMMMKQRGHHVEVFCSSPTRTISEQSEGVTVHRVQCVNRDQFRSVVLEKFSERHAQVSFDLFESPEYFGDGYEIKLRFPELALVVKLHTPQFLIFDLTNQYVRLRTKIRYILGGLKRGKLVRGFWKWKRKEEDIDYKLFLLADQVHTPSVSLGDIVSKAWNMSRKRIINVPYPFIPDSRFLKIENGANRAIVTFIGRLEVRKGIRELVEAVPEVIRAVPFVKFRFVGKDLPSHIGGVTMKEYIMSSLSKFASHLEFLSVTPDGIPEVLQTTDVCVFPSIWENFPNVCLESMSAGKAIVGSREGGMKDMLTDPECGILVDPLNPKEIAAGIIRLLTDKRLCERYGNLARQQVLKKYNSEVIGELMETEYSKLLKN